MAKGENAKRYFGKEWWGKRPLAGVGVHNKHGTKFWKRLLHKIERRFNKKEISHQLHN